MQNEIEEVIAEAIARAGGLRKLAKELVPHTPGGFRPVSPAQLSNIATGIAAPDGRTLLAMSGLYQDLATRLYVAMGLTRPRESPESYEWRAIRQAAEDAARKSDEGKSAPEIAREAMEHYGYPVPQGEGE